MDTICFSTATAPDHSTRRGYKTHDRKEDLRTPETSFHAHAVACPNEDCGDRNRVAGGNLNVCKGMGSM
jgi:hypothetical protein